MDKAKTVEERVKEFCGFMNITYGFGACRIGHVSIEFRRHLTAHGEQVQREERERWEKLCHEELFRPKAKTGSWQAEWHAAYETLMCESKKGGRDGSA